jgi:hypothetical protein
LNVEIKTAGNQVSLPLEHVTTNPDPAPDPAQKKNPVQELLQNLAPPLAAIDVGSLSIGLNDVRLTARLRLSSGSAIDPAGDETFFSVGPFSMTIPRNMFKQLLPGDFTFVGTVDGRDVTANFVRSALDPNEWTFSAAVQSVQLQGIPALQPPLQVPVQIGVGTDTGKGLATALFL